MDSEHEEASPPTLDHRQWTDKAGASRAAQCREETIDLWIRQGRFAPEEAYRTSERRGVGFSWVISMAALERIVRAKGRPWHPELAAPVAPLPAYLVALLTLQQQQIVDLTAQLERVMRRQERVRPPITPQPSMAMDSPLPVPTQPRRRTKKPDTFPPHLIAVSTWCEVHRVANQQRSVFRDIDKGKLQAEHSPEDDPWLRAGQYPIRTAFTPEQHLAACIAAAQRWPKIFEPCGPDCPYLAWQQAQ